MQILVEALVWLVLLVVGIKLFLYTRRLARGSRLKWRRRVGLLFFLAPLLAWVGGLVLPEAMLLPLRALQAVNQGIEASIQWLLSLAEAGLTGIWLAAARPLCYAIVYTAAGVIVGWPLDRLSRRKAAPESDAETARR